MAGRTVDITIEDMAQSGSGMGTLGRRTAFVPFTIPGERVQAHIVDEEGEVLYAEGVKLLLASGDRVYPNCAIFGKRGCIRCSWQHIAYEAQLLIKQDILGDQLERVGKVTNPVIMPTIPAPNPWEYMHQVTFNVLPDGNLGLPGRENNGKTLVKNEACALFHPKIGALLDLLDLDLVAAGIDRIKLSVGSDDAEMITLFTTNEDAPELEADIPASVNLLLPDNEPVNLIGESHVRYAVRDRLFRVTVGSYYRANAAQMNALMDRIEAWLEPKPEDRLLDLYAGVGVFSAFLAPKVSLVTLVESYPPAATDADDNLAHLENVDVIEGGVADVLATFVDEGAGYSIAIIDPPGSGITDDLARDLAALGVARLLYVSDNAATLARDCRRLTKVGFKMKQAGGIDFSPQTWYLDSTALFVRG